MISISYGQAPKKIEGKPDYAETVKFIKANIHNELFNKGLEYETKTNSSGNYFFRNTYKITEMNFSENCVLDIEYSHSSVGILLSNGNDFNYKHNVIQASIDFSKIESIDVLIGETGHKTNDNQDIFMAGLFFKTSGENESVEIQVPLGLYGSNGENRYKQIKNTQMYKAFDHLRKLCGAPEPITF
jgi:hypothetical protein